MVWYSYDVHDRCD